MGGLVTGILVLHFMYLGYVVLGGFLAWRWPAAIWAHLVACVWAALIVAEQVNCPLTAAEDWARQRAGQAPLTQGFIDRYLDNVIYPDEYVNQVRLAVAVVVAVSWIGAYVRWRRGRGAARPEPEPRRGRGAVAGRHGVK